MEILIPLDQIRYCPTELMIADVLTKPIHGNRQRQLKNEMLGEG